VIFFWGVGQPLDKPVIGELVPGKPAEQAGLMSGDIINSIDGEEITSWMKMAEVIHASPGKALKLDILRGEEKLVCGIVPEADPGTGKGMIGITPALEMSRIGFLSSVKYGVGMVVFQSVFTLKYLGERLIKWEKPDVAGPIGVVQILAKSAKAGIEELLHILAVISTALGLFNLLPIPLVDGGHIMFSFVEGITRRPLNRKVLYVTNVLGLGFIIMIFLLATYNDLGRLGLNFTKLFGRG